MEEKKSDEKQTPSPHKALSERLKDAVESLRRKGKEASSDQHEAEDFLNRRR
jgi:hypothetical protein